jgi:hypothetical protein
MEKKRSKKYIAWILAIAMAFTGLGMNFSTAYAKPWGPPECGKTFNLEAYKVLENKDLEAGDFEFVAYKADANGDPTGPVLATGTNDADGNISFSNITVTKDGTYRYVLKEVIPDDEDKIDGVIYDESSKLVTVKVSGNEYVQTISDVIKIDKSQSLYLTTGDANYAVIKQSTFAIVWTEDLLGPNQRAEIKKQVQMWDNSTMNDFYYIHGEGTFLDWGASRNDDLGHSIPGNAGPYTFSITSDGEIKLECRADRISHLDYGIYGAKATFTNTFLEKGSIDVTKAVKLDGSAWTDFDGDFYAALFNDEALTDMAQGPEKIEVTNGTSATVTFDDLDRKTYYLAETDADSNVISTGSVIDDKELTGISGTGAIALTLLDGEESATITNDYTTIKGSLKVTKALGGESNSDAGSFWFMVYDEEEAAVTEDPLEITRNADGTYNEVTVSDLSLGQYKIVETDSEGDPLETDIVLFGMKLATITYDQQTATLTVAAKDKNITITNTFEKIKGKIKVNKSITGAASGKEDFDETFYFGLFTKEGDQYTLVANSVISANSTNGADFTALFENVELGTYYVAETDANGNITEAGETSGQYKLAEVTGQYSEAVLTNESTAPQAEVDIENKYEYFGKINVTKKIFLNDEEKQSYSDSFWVALFDESDQRYGDPKEIEMTGGDANKVVFENLPFGDYVLYETDAQGNKLSGPESGRTPEWIDITYENNEVSLTEEAPSADVVVNNYFEEKDDPYFGSIEVTKKVTYNGKATGTSLTFYTALFADKEGKEIVTEVKALEMNGKDNVSVIFDKDKNGENLPAETVYYVAETDKDGNPITDPKGYTIRYENEQKVEMDAENDYVGKTTITNQYEGDDEEFYYYDENGTKVTTVKTSATSSETKTGDDINIGLLILLALIGVAGAITPFALRKKAKEESDK